MIEHQCLLQIYSCFSRIQEHVYAHLYVFVNVCVCTLTYQTMLLHTYEYVCIKFSAQSFATALIWQGAQEVLAEQKGLYSNCITDS